MTSASNRESWWSFSGQNLQAHYGYGSEHEAERYREYLNRARDINCYEAEEVTDPDEIAELEDGNEGSTLSEDLLEICHEDALSARIIETIRAEMRGCCAEAMRQGWDDEPWEATAVDIEWITDRVRDQHGREPTDVEWADADGERLADAARVGDGG